MAVLPQTGDVRELLDRKFPWIVLWVCPLTWLEVPSPSLHKMLQFGGKDVFFFLAVRIAKHFGSRVFDAPKAVFFS